MSRSNYDKPFYVDIGTSMVAIRCASNHDVIFEYDYEKCPQVIKFAKDNCDRMNKEAAIGRPPRNCDLYETEDDAWEAFCKIHPDAKCPDEYWSEQYQIWLFEQAKGE